MIELVAGGARSGKSAYALRAAENMQGNLIFVATAEVGDAAMQQRIKLHQDERSAKWALVEAPLDLASVINRHGAGNILLIDCLTLWLTNWMLLSGQDTTDDRWLDGWREQKSAFINGIKNTNATVFLVTNEVGQGVVPMGQLSRDFVDHAGWMHQEIAAIADNVTMVTFGLPQYLKKSV